MTHTYYVCYTTACNISKLRIIGQEKMNPYEIVWHKIKIVVFCFVVVVLSNIKCVKVYIIKQFFFASLCSLTVCCSQL